MDSQPLCYVVADDGRWPGKVIAWRRGPHGWRALVRFRAPHASGHILNYEHWLDASALTPR